MRRALFTLILLLFGLASFGQSSSDTLNRFNSKNHKDGYWVFYCDSLFQSSDKSNAKYYGYIHYYDGYLKAKPPVMKFGKNSKVVYKPYADTSKIEHPILLNGEIFNYSLEDSKQILSLYDSYVNGKHSTSKQFFCDRRDSACSVDFYYWDSLYKNEPKSVLYYKIDNGILLYKQYIRNKHDFKNHTDRAYFVKHRDYKYRNTIYLGCSGTAGKLPDRTLISKDFFEMGFSKNYIQGFFMESIKKNFRDQEGVFQSLNFSLLASNTKGNFCFGQKFTYSYNLFLLKSEIGLVNYTDFKKNDLRIIFGIGVTFMGYLGEMLVFTVPLTKTPFGEIGRVTVTIGIN